MRRVVAELSGAPAVQKDFLIPPLFEDKFGQRLCNEITPIVASLVSRIRCSKPGHRALVAIHAARGPGRNLESLGLNETGLWITSVEVFYSGPLDRGLPSVPNQMPVVVSL
jgi:hypothetical protein